MVADDDVGRERREFTSTCETSGHEHGSAVARPVAGRGHLCTRAAWNRLCAQQDPDLLTRTRAGARALPALAVADRPPGTGGAPPRAAQHPSSRKDEEGRMNAMKTVAQ